MKYIHILLFLVFFQSVVGQVSQTYDTLCPMRNISEEWTNKVSYPRLVTESKPLSEILSNVEKTCDSVFLCSYGVNSDRLVNIALIVYKKNTLWWVSRIETYFIPRTESDINSSGVWIYRQYSPVYVTPNWRKPIDTMFSEVYKEVSKCITFSHGAPFATPTYYTHIYLKSGKEQLYQIYGGGQNILYRVHKPIWEALAYFMMESLSSDDYSYIYSTGGIRLLYGTCPPDE